MKNNFLIYGANGYTGALIARTAVSKGMKPVLAGRDRHSIAKVAAELGLSYRIFGLDHKVSLNEELRDVSVILNVAGPFAETSLKFAEACLKNHVHYLDIAGEVPEFEALLAFDERALQAGIMMMPGVGFGIVPTDCMAVYLKEKLPSAERLTLAFATEGGVSQGTLKTVLKDLHKEGVVRKDGKLQPMRAAQKSLTIDFQGKKIKTVYNPWRGDLSTAFRSTGIPDIETYSAFPGTLAFLMSKGGAIGGLWGSGTMQNLLGNTIRKFPVGPTDEQLQSGKTYVWGEVEGGGQKKTAMLTGSEAYLFTAYSALKIVEKVLAGNAPAGYQTPATAYGAGLVQEIEGVTLTDL